MLATGLRFPEGPAYAPDGALWGVEIEGGALFRLAAGQLTRFPVGGAPNGLAFDARGRAWFCDAGGEAVRRFDPATLEVETVVAALDGERLGRPNDLVFDAAGNLIFTCPNNARTEPVGSVCCLSPEGRLSRVAEGLYFPNGLALLEGGAVLVVAETYRQRLWRGAWNAEQRAWLEPRPWSAVCEPVFGTGPDGLALGADGLLYVAVFGTGAVKAVGAEGQVARVLEVPGSRPTNLAFDSNGRHGLVVTEAERGRLLRFTALGPGAALYDGGAAWA